MLGDTVAVNFRFCTWQMADDLISSGPLQLELLLSILLSSSRCITWRHPGRMIVVAEVTQGPGPGRCSYLGSNVGGGAAGGHHFGGGGHMPHDFGGDHGIAVGEAEVLMVEVLAAVVAVEEVDIGGGGGGFGCSGGGCDSGGGGFGGGGGSCDSGGGGGGGGGC
ncbi:ctenidin-3-like [Durio zibethinus]|uniref:Ctenidin-3-like n=1 Tax=Durio zibethinus TaxID=66656 RepID=A0A6P6ALX0_DURZI|nr:ctenidin-3-like [Durio zibethinus]